MPPLFVDCAKGCRQRIDESMAQTVNHVGMDG